jgi:succinate dehydrogenase flavin-adding protein (antitoxin of CptAB toxin-antitoxin module)
MTRRTAVLSSPDDCGSLDALRRKLRFRAGHRGTKEADLLLEAFAERSLTAFAAEELDQFRRLLEEDDPIIDLLDPWPAHRPEGARQLCDGVAEAICLGHCGGNDGRDSHRI